MSFHPGQTFVFGEQPSATKWQYLWDNDYALADGTGLSDDIILSRHIADDAVLPDHISNPYKAKAHAGSNQTIADATATVITFGTEDYDPNGNFASNAYTVPKTGYYQVNCNVVISANGKGASYRMNVRKNSTDIAQVQHVPFPAATTYGDVTLTYSDVLFLTATNVIDFRALCDTSDSSSPSILGAATNQQTFCSFHLLST